MPEIQGSYADNIGQAFEGMVVDQGHRNAITRQVEDATLAFARVVSQGTDDDQVIVGGASIIGVTMLDKTLTTDGYVEGDSAAILTQGPMWVVATEAVAANDPVAFDPATGEFNSSGTAYPGAKYSTTGAIGDLVKIVLA